MFILLDTNVLMWALGDKARLSAKVQAALTDPQNDILFSAASIWEIAIKFALGRADFSVTPEDMLRGAVETGFTELPVTAATALSVARLPLHHKDPFDRLLVAQALAEPAVLYTADRHLAAYSPDLVTVIPAKA